MLLTFVDDPDIGEGFLVELSGDDAQLLVYDANGNLIVADGAVIDFETRQSANVTLSAINLNGVLFSQDLESDIGNRSITDIAMASGGTVRENAAADTVVATFEASENPVEPTANISIVLRRFVGEPENEAAAPLRICDFSHARPPETAKASPYQCGGWSLGTGRG